MRRTGGLLCAVAVVLLSGCEKLHPDVVKGGTVGGPETPSAKLESSAEATPRPVDDVMPQREPRPAAFYQPGTGIFVGQPLPTSTTAGGGNITLNFENTNLREVVKVILGDLLDANYSIDPGVQGAVTLQTSEPLARRDLIPTLELLLRMNGAALVSQNGLYNVVPRDNAMRGMLSPQLGNSGQALPQGYSVRIVHLAFVAAEEMQKILEPFTSPGNIVRVDTVRNLLILAGSGPELDQSSRTCWRRCAYSMWTGWKACPWLCSRRISSTPKLSPPSCRRCSEKVARARCPASSSSPPWSA